MADAQSIAIQYAPFNSRVHPGFWNTFTKLKLDVLGLTEKSIDATASYYNNDAPGLPSRISVEWDSIQMKPNKGSIDETDLHNKSSPALPWNVFKCKGSITNLNTLDSFKNLNKNDFLTKEAGVVWNAINDGTALKRPDEFLNRFSILMYADLKKYHYYYWFAFPAFVLPKEIRLLPQPDTDLEKTRLAKDKTWNKMLSQCCSPKACEILSEQYQIWRKSMNNRNSSSFFCVNIDMLKGATEGKIEELNTKPIFKTLHEGLSDSKFIPAFADPCTLENHPGWPLRNLLLLLTKCYPERLQKGLQVFCFRQQIVKGEGDSPNKITASNSLLFRIGLGADDTAMPDLKDIFTGTQSAVGWEKNEKGTGFGPRMANLRSSMDPSHLAASSVDLNLKLMKWRLLPDIDLDTIKHTKCLLLGSGTLGCNVARCLLGWGIRNITFVDNGKVSYSNPVRQSLFTFEDCQKGGRDKALAAADALKKIFPAVTAKGYSLTIPMPAHPLSSSTEADVREQYCQLEELIKSHDVIYLLMDTRESRWLPTVMGAYYDKLVINSALGFDSYLVMRHGRPKKLLEISETKATPNSILVPGEKLGCYFCNDVVAPGNSTTDRTLDQQCTVTRPGASYMAGSLAVELMVSTLQHPKGSLAPALTCQNLSSEQEESIFGEVESLLGSFVPHSIRGSLHTLTQFLPTTQAFDHCTACSPKILEAFAEKGFEFIREIANTNGSEYLEKIAGLENLMAEVNMDDIVTDFDIESD